LEAKPSVLLTGGFAVSATPGGDVGKEPAKREIGFAQTMPHHRYQRCGIGSWDRRGDGKR
jgi:hypothetical protein